jgi:hypothetical protein
MTARSFAGWLLFAAVLWPCQGCLQTLVTALVAPEAVAMQGASGAANAVTASLSGEDLVAINDFSTTAKDLDRILQDHPDAANRPELEALRQQLDESQKTSQHRRREGSAELDPERRAEGDRRVALPPSANPFAKPVSDALVIEKLPAQRRGAPLRPQTYPDPVVIEPSHRYQYQFSLHPVRVH